MAYLPHKKAGDGRPAKGTNGRPITAGADCCNCGGGGDCCRTWTGNICDFGSMTLQVSGSFTVSARTEQDLGFGLEVVENLPATRRTFDNTASAINCGSIVQFGWLSDPLFEAGAAVTLDLGVTANPSSPVLVVGAPGATDFWTQGPSTVNANVHLEAIWSVSSTFLVFAAPFLSTRYGAGLQSAPETPGTFGGHSYWTNSNGISQYNRATNEEQSSSTGNVVVARNACTVTYTLSATSSRTLVTRNASNQITRRQRAAQSLTATAVLTLGPCGPAGILGPGGGLIDPAVDAVFREYGKCRGCGDGNQMA